MKFLKEWGGWISTLVTVTIAVAVFYSTQKAQAEDIERANKTLDEISKFMEEQLYLNGQIVKYMEMDSR